MTISADAVASLIGWGLLHSVWEGLIIAGIAWMFLLLMRRRSPNLRYVLALSALLLMFLVPAVTVLYATPVPMIDTAAAARPAVNLAPMPTRAAEPVAVQTTTQAPVQASAPTPPSWHDRLQHWSRLIEPWMPGLTVGWMVGVMLLALWNLGGWIQVRRMAVCGVSPVPETWLDVAKSLSMRIGVSHSVSLLQSERVCGPVVIGWLKPVVLVPAAVLSGLTPEQVEAILAHELAHVRRYDYLVNLVQTAIVTLLFYHPAAWWLSRRIRIEREHCCDDIAVAACGDSMTYARSLAALGGLGLPPTRMAMAAKGGVLYSRIRRILMPPQPRPQGLASLSSVAVVVLAILGITFTWQHALAKSDPDSNLAPHFPVQIIALAGHAPTLDGFGKNSIYAPDSQTGTVGATVRFGQEENASEVKWKLVDSQNGKDIYQFDWWSPEEVPGRQHIEKTIAYEGQSVVVFDDDEKFVAMIPFSPEFDVLPAMDTPEATVRAFLQSVVAKETGRALMLVDQCGQYWDVLKILCAEQGDEYYPIRMLLEAVDLDASASGMVAAGGIARQEVHWNVMLKKDVAIGKDTLRAGSTYRLHVELWKAGEGKWEIRSLGEKLADLLANGTSNGPEPPPSPELKTTFGVGIEAKEKKGAGFISGTWRIAANTPQAHGTRGDADKMSDSPIVTWKLIGNSPGKDIYQLTCQFPKNAPKPTFLEKTVEYEGKPITVFERDNITVVMAPLVKTPLDGDVDGAPLSAIGVDLPDGTRAELVAIRRHGGQGPFWAPDGTVLEETLYDAVDGASVSGGEAYEFLVKGNGMGTAYDIEGASTTASGKAMKDGKKLEDNFRVLLGAVSSGQTTTTIGAQVYVGDWIPLMISEKTSSGARGHGEWSSIFGEPYQDGDSVVVTFTLTGNAIYWPIRLIAVNEAGVACETWGHSYGGSSVQGAKQIIYKFFGLNLDDVAAFRLEARAVRTVEFKDISLVPGQLTEPKAELLPQREDQIPRGDTNF